jgi:hypothetical protein
MIKRSWVRTLAPYTGWMQAMLAITYTKKNENKGSRMGTPKNILKQYGDVRFYCDKKDSYLIISYYNA